MAEIKEKSEYDGHRQRIKQQYWNGGLDSFCDARALELLLTFAIPRKDTYPLAKELMERFGSFSRVLEVGPETLEQVPGMSRNAAMLLSLVLDAGRRYLLDRSRGRQEMRTVEDCGEYLAPFFYGKRDEEVYLLSLDARGRVLNCQRMGQGSVNSANVPVRRIVTAALNANAVTAVLAHNHPSGIALPSREDIAATKLVQDALEAVGIELLDHLIIADSDFVSLKQSGFDEGVPLYAKD